jgi:hypothetical protein
MADSWRAIRRPKGGWLVLLATERDDNTAATEASVRRRAWPFFGTFGVTFAFLLSLMAWWIYSPSQDHFASISLNGDDTWYHNYEIAFEIQDQEIFYHKIGRSIENERKADIIFLGTSRILFGLDEGTFDAFERKHHLRMFNMGLAGVPYIEFSLRVIRKYGLHPKLWIIHTDLDERDIRYSFFYERLVGAEGFGSGVPDRVVNYSRLRVYRNVIGRNIRWRLKMAVGLLGQDPYRSANTGNWYLDRWPNYASETNASIKPLEHLRAQRDRTDPTCPALPAEVESAKSYLAAIGGAAVLIQVPSAFACAQRTHELATAIGVASFTVNPALFTSVDGGGHLDRVSARKYSTMLFTWLEQLPEFQKLFAAPDGAKAAPTRH